MTKAKALESLFERADTVWAKQATAWGACHTLNEGVPFSLRNGPSYAQKLVNYFRTLVSSLGELQPPYTLCEFGAGAGFLSRNIIRYLKQVDPELFEQCHFYITEATDAYVELLKKDPELSQHPNITVLTYDVTHPIPNTIPPLAFAYSVYLLDALDTQRFYVENEALFEVCYKSTFPEKIKLLNTAHYPPKVISEQEVQAFLDKETLETRKLIPLLQASVQTHSHFVPIEDTDCSMHHQQELRAFVQKNEQATSYYFHDSPALKFHVNAVSEHLEDGGVYVISDFGQHTKIGTKTEQELEARYGTTRYFSVCFPLHQSRLPNVITSWITQRALDQTQEWILYTGKHGDLMAKKAKEHFHEMGDEKIAKVLETFTQFEPNDPDYQVKLNTALTSLSNADKQDYFLLQSLATQCIHDQLYADALEFIQILEKTYGPLAIHVYQLKGAILQLTGHYHEAIQCYRDAVLLCQNNTASLTGLSVCLAMVGQYDQAIEMFKMALQQSVGNLYWENLLFFVQLLQKMDKKDTLMSLLQWCDALHKSHPSLIPSQVDTYLKTLHA